ncbi:MAG: polyphosphate kinase 1 [Verrucomicrobiota bacterium]
MTPSETQTASAKRTPAVRWSKAADRFLNRELSSIDWSTRVLEQAFDTGLPLLERVRYAAFFSSHMDEFFAVRVAGLLDQLASGLPVRSADGRTPRATLAEIRRRVESLTERQARLWADDLVPALAAEGIRIGEIADCTEEELEELAVRFRREIYPVLTPLAVGPGQPFPYISALSLSLGVFVRDPESGEERLARVKVPEGLPRFVEVGTRGLYVRLESVITHFLGSLFPQMEIGACAVFRLTRDADFELSDEADDLLEAVQLELRRRRFGDIVRVEVAESAAPELLDRIKRGLRADDDQVYLVPEPLALADAMQLTEMDRPDLKEEPWAPVTPARFDSEAGVMFSEIARSDVLVHQPYDSFAASFEAFVRTAASDPDVIGLKATVYRTSNETPLVPALIEAAENGKQTVCLVELTARFDERRNIEWSQALERAGVHVVHGFPNRKVHAKAVLVVRREPGGLRRYVHIGTGNYHSLTARLYEDFGLFTADPDIADDIANLFNYVTGFGKPERFRKLLVAPFDLRDRLIEEIRRVAQAAAAKKHAAIRIKVNHLSDPAIIDELYLASEAGAKIDLIVRSVCALRPGVKGLSENIRVRSVLGRFLEHSRVYHFEARHSRRYFVGSADLLPRNLDHRLEAVVPVEDARLQQRVGGVLDALLEDETAWELQPDGTWKRHVAKKPDQPRSGQAALMRSARRRRRPRRVS